MYNLNLHNVIGQSCLKKLEKERKETDKQNKTGKQNALLKMVHFNLNKDLLYYI